MESPIASPLLARLAAHPPDRVAMTAGGAAVSYRDVDTRTTSMAAALASGGDLRGARVAFLAEAGPTHLMTLLGILRAGGVAVPLSPLHTRPELEFLIGDAGPVRLLATAGQRAALEAAAGGRSVLDVDTLVSGARLPATPARDAPAIMLYTSGTTGRPKGVRLSHAAVAATVEALEGAWRWRADDRLLHVLPLHHTHGLIVAALGALWAGAEVRFLPFEARAAWEALADATVFMAVPTIYAKLLDAFRAADDATRARWTAHAARLRLFTSGSAALPAGVLEEFRAATTQTILERYGMTEIGMALSNPYDGPRVPGAVGAPLPGVEVDVVRDDGAPADVDEPGELRVRSTQMFSGYHGDEAATASSFDGEGRFRTGDTGRRDAAGVIRILGRTSVDIIKSAGYKLSALEIEAALREHPAVAEVAVVGVPDASWGEVVTACVVARAGARVALDDLVAFARAHLAPYKLPRALRLCDALPRNAMGKVQKKQLLREIGDGA
ncbi:MAG TPA: acyl-CoA synthetase [Polyangia bacterium]|nr:acyl-CoA synthetase [Polyangia bacterium]